MKYTEFKELLSHELGTMMIEARILNPCLYDKKFGLEFDEFPSLVGLHHIIKYLRKVGAEKIILNFRKDDNINPLKVVPIFQPKGKDLTLESVKEILKTENILDKVIIFEKTDDGTEDSNI